jgi:hypothetical protein
MRECAANFHPWPRLAEHTRIWRLTCLFVSSSAIDESTRACSVDLHTVGGDFGSLPAFAKWKWAPLRPATRRAGANVMTIEQTLIVR